MDTSRRALLTGWLRPTGGTPRLELQAGRCLACQGIVCTTCAVACSEDAIAFDERGRPRLIADLCTACGDCILPCPAHAWRLST